MMAIRLPATGKAINAERTDARTRGERCLRIGSALHEEQLKRMEVPETSIERGWGRVREEAIRWEQTPTP